MAFSTAAVLYSFLMEVKRPKRRFRAVEMSGDDDSSTGYFHRGAYRPRTPGTFINNNNHHYKI
jgi:hypothetical protein